jgi:predicted TIM-barrel fold metal-dependent hydrolase
MDQAGIQQFNIVAALDPYAANHNPAGLYAKAQEPERIYLFGGLDHFSTDQDDTEAAASDLAAQVDRLQAMGCDGIKMIEGKPTVYKRLPYPFDGPLYASFFARAEEAGFPLIWHVNDPASFWDPERVRPWVRERGWFYGDGGYPDPETLYSQVERVLARHPDLTVIFAHFLFLAGDLERASGILSQYPNVYLDLTPGTEMYFQFEEHPEATRAFFLRYQHRIIFGTDASDRALASEAGWARTQGKVDMMRRFLETSDHFDADPLVQREGWVQGIDLPTDVLLKIYRDNFCRLVGERPAALDLALASEECRRLAALFDRNLGEDLMGMPRPKANIPRMVAEDLAEMASTGAASNREG